MLITANVLRRNISALMPRILHVSFHCSYSTTSLNFIDKKVIAALSLVSTVFELCLLLVELNEKKRDLVVEMGAAALSAPLELVFTLSIPSAARLFCSFEQECNIFKTGEEASVLAFFMKV